MTSGLDLPADICGERRRSRVGEFLGNLGIASLVLGIVWIWGLGSLLAVIFGAVHMKQASREGRNASGMAVAGLILGIIGLVGAVVLSIALALAAGSAPTPAPIYG